MNALRTTPITMQRQRGAAFMVMLIFLVMGIAAYLVSSLSSKTVQISRDEVTAKALAQAKEALIGRAASDITNPMPMPGQLPCPEDTSLIGFPAEGQALTACNTPSLRVGRLPWRSLGLGDIRDGNGDKLWYVLSAGFRIPPLNSDTQAQLTVDGVANKAVAIIFSPGAPINGQIRAVPTDITQFLEFPNNTGSNTFVSTGPTGTLNDKLLIVTHDDLFRVVERRVAREVINALNGYYSVNHFFPRPADFTSPTCLGGGSLAACNSGASNRGRIPANPGTAWDPVSILRGTIGTDNWFQSNKWREVIFYAVATACIDGTTNCTGPGTYLTLNNPAGATLSNQKVVVIATGAALPTQTRASNILSDYLEDENLTPLDDIYTKSVASPSIPFNDIATSIP